ncbi:MAG TPA: indolepyruvate oxidoreductase subunit beta [bacterium]|nr:indolepyruvate oxidoreductase subunit beta [bacterium]
MKQDIILAGVGGQGILSIAFVIDNAALKQGLYMKQAEVHGMAQRGGGVQSHLRLSEEAIYSDLVPRGRADLILSVEPLEALRYIEYLGPEGRIVTSSTPMINIPDYPPLDEVLAAIRKFKGSVIVDSAKLAQEAGAPQTQNMVMLGAASRYLMLKVDDLREFIGVLFGARGEKIVAANLEAFDLGRQASEAGAA